MESRLGLPMQLYNQNHGFDRSKSGCAGNAYNGKQIREIIQPENLQDMYRYLGESDEAKIWIQYIESVSAVYYCMVKQQRDPQYEKILQHFNDCFSNVQSLGVNQTLKAHLVGSHVADYMKETGLTMWRSSDESCESTHSKLRKREELHNFKVTKNLASSHKKRKSSQSFNFFNAKNLKKTKKRKYK